jgi:hypothetical protein
MGGGTSVDAKRVGIDSKRIKEIRCVNDLLLIVYTLKFSLIVTPLTDHF